MTTSDLITWPWNLSVAALLVLVWLLSRRLGKALNDDDQWLPVLPIAAAGLVTLTVLRIAGLPDPAWIADLLGAALLIPALMVVHRHWGWVAQELRKDKEASYGPHSGR